jgi:hypothetical protein
MFANISQFPLDILIIIFSFIPVRPRILVVSSICKRWRIASLQSITSFYFSDTDPQPILSILPNVYKLKFDNNSKFILPNFNLCRLSDLELVFCSYTAINHPIYNLTRLSICSANEIASSIILRDNTTSLRQLQIKEFRLNSLNFLSLGFPYLTNLEIFLAYDIGVNFYQWLHKHGSQLISFSLFPDRVCALMPRNMVPFSLPNLRSLCLNHNSSHLLPNLRIPNNCTIEFHRYDPSGNHLTYVDKIVELLPPPNESIPVPFLLQATALTCLSISIKDLSDHFDIINQLSNNLIKLRLHGNDDNFPMINLNYFSKLKILSLNNIKSIPDNIPGLFPQIIQLFWKLSDGDEHSNNLFEFLNTILLFPLTLRYIHLYFAGFVLTPFKEITEPLNNEYLNIINMKKRKLEEDTENSISTLSAAWSDFVWLLEQRGIEILHLSCGNEYIGWLRKKYNWIDIRKT